MGKQGKFYFEASYRRGRMEEEKRILRVRGSLDQQSLLDSYTPTLLLDTRDNKGLPLLHIFDNPATNAETSLHQMALDATRFVPTTFKFPTHLQSHRRLRGMSSEMLISALLPKFHALAPRYPKSPLHRSSSTFNMASLKDQLPWTTAPIIINAPMAGVAGGNLASTVSLSGGLGLIGGLFDMQDLRFQLQTASEAFNSSPEFSATSAKYKTLPVGISFLPFVLKLQDALPVVQEFKPSVVWLFAAKELDDYADWANGMREVSPETRIWIQCGSVESALYIAKAAKPDVLCLQGADAGGHGFEKGAGIISLLPEAADALARQGLTDIALTASGGIVDGRGVAAALALGAEGVVMGTRFLAAKETDVHPKYRAAILEAQDGGQTTTRSKLFDNLNGPNKWPAPYDGRSLLVQSYTDHLNGVGIEEIRRLHKESTKSEDLGYATEGKGRAAIWAGTGVGLVEKVEGAKEIVEESKIDIQIQSKTFRIGDKQNVGERTCNEMSYSL
ncbi:inosine monophosphate dehydrogenase [Lindgomyces ingoldianus]|uniref:Inosine monophosphate dehydrogenase n=1 Tax=Lindgomyces ingoldianus TaxID=673940 RepID=A0ACB6QR54_9PLEO|nr:inosine monophosphate dehydrogenase [Lindgomyces ingoldianus]KAF2469504.1 inosine monophosphate dehydrogenase [Lindgomyces ingoldianus]